MANSTPRRAVLTVVLATLAAFVVAERLAWAQDTAPRRSSAAGGSTTRSMGSKGKLVPFPEDEQPSAARPAAPAPRSSNFQPRFRSPNVQPAQHLEPSGKSNDVEPAAHLAPQDEPSTDRPTEGADDEPPATDKPAATNAPAGKSLVEQAYAHSKSASTEADYAAMLDECRRALDAGLDPTFADYARKLMGWAYNRRGELHAQQGHDEQALADFEMAVENGGAWRAIHNRGVSYAALGRLDQALADLDRAIELNRRYPNAYFNRGELKYQQGDYSGALADYSTALELNPNDSAILNSRGHALYRLERFGEALRDYGAAIQRDPENAAALINRGDTFSDLGQYSDAARDYRAAVRIAPQMASAYHSISWFMATCPDAHYRNEQLAIEAAQKAIELDGENFRSLSTLAAAQASAGNFDDARRAQEKAIAAARGRDVVTAEKMLALYQRDLAYRERPRTAFTPPEHLDDQVQQAAHAEPAPPEKKSPLSRFGRWPTRQASGSQPARTSGRPPGQPR